jgi:hypothetical protein
MNTVKNLFHCYEYIDVNKVIIICKVLLVRKLLGLDIVGDRHHLVEVIKHQLQDNIMPNLNFREHREVGLIVLE